MVQADFDEDTIPDLVISNANSGEIVFVKGRRDSDYFDFPSVPVEVGDGPRGMAAALIDNDAHLDLVVANQGPDGAPGSVSVLQGDGQGGFTVVQQPDPTPKDPNHTAPALISDPTQASPSARWRRGQASRDQHALNTITVYIGNGDLAFEGHQHAHRRCPEDALWSTWTMTGARSVTAAASATSCR
jgi:hypothetical protein